MLTRASVKLLELCSSWGVAPPRKQPHAGALSPHKALLYVLTCG